MNMMWRFLLVFLTTKYISTASFFKLARKKFIALPSDIDFYGHINNGRYFSFLDLARISVLVETKIMAILRKNEVYGVVACEMIRFKKSIGIFKKFEITTQIIYWDDKYFYIKQCFYMKDELCAFALVKIRFLHKQRGVISPAEVFKIANLTEEASAMPNYVEHLNAAEKELFANVLASGP